LARRRGNGEGAIYRRGDGRWCGAISLGYDPDGKLRRKVVYGKTKREVQEKLAILQHDAATGRPIPDSHLTVARHFEDWLRAKKTSVRSSTYNQNEGHVRVHILPYLGHVRLIDLDYRQINLFYEHLQASDLAPRTIYDISSILRAGLKDAADKRIIRDNPALLAARLSRGDREASFLAPQELAAFLTAAKGERLEDAFIVALNTGMRPGEWLGLAWQDVDLPQAKLTVRQALHEEKGRLFLGPVKTRAGRRTISLPKEAVKALQRQRTRQMKDKLVAGGTWVNEWGLVFTNTRGGALYRTNIAKRDMKRILDRASLDGVTLHTFRHTHASLLIAAGEDIKTVSRRLGHEKITITLQTYGHLMPGRDEEAANAMDAIFANLPPAKTI